MPKMKTNRAAAKRFKRTAGGKIKYRKSFRAHLLGSKDRKRKRHLRGSAYVDETRMAGLRKLLPYI